MNRGLSWIARLSVIEFVFLFFYTLFRLDYIPASIVHSKSVVISPSPVKSTLPAAKPTQVISKEPIIDVTSHNSESDCWVKINGHIYDVTSYLASHPGGKGAILPSCGSDATLAFETKGSSPAKPHSDAAKSLLLRYLVK